MTGTPAAGGWEYNVIYSLAREQVNERLRQAIQDRADQNNDRAREHGIEPGSQVWFYLDRVKEGYARKLAHMWHGPFRIAELVGEHAVKLVTAGTDYNVFPIVHVSKLKLVKHFPDRPNAHLTVESDRFDFDEDLLPENSWDKPLDSDEYVLYEVEEILDVQNGWKTRFGRIHREFLVQWKNSEERSLVDELDLKCGALMREFDRRRASGNRFGVMQTHEEGGAEPEN